MENLSLSQAAAELIAQFEGFRANPYLDSVNIPTIGYGTTFYENGKKVALGDPPVTKDRAMSLMLNYLNVHTLPTFKANIKVQLQQHQVDALASLAYNIGNQAFKDSSVLKDLNNNITSGASLEAHWKAWNKAQGKVLQGLVNRREKEWHYFVNGKL